jgi:enoyl-CoA hydratase/carnithine racemase
MSLLVEREGAVGVLTLNRPEQRNALNAELRGELARALKEFDLDESVRAIVITGSGSVFCAGADLKEMAATGLTVIPSDFIPDIGAVSKVVIAAVNGPALGGGFFLAQQADLVVAAESATFGIPEAKHGRGAPWAAPLALLIPPRAVVELIATAAPISARRGYELGLVNQVVPDGAAAAAALAMAQQIASNAPLSVGAGKQMVRSVLMHALGSAPEVVEALWEPVYLSQDAQEGPRAFAEKRAPRWQGR